MQRVESSLLVDFDLTPLPLEYQDLALRRAIALGAGEQELAMLGLVA